jgi:uncharacterized protein YegL
MNSNYTHISFVVDRSGSMTSIAQDMSGGLKTLLDKQKKELGKCTVSLSQFDGEYETVYEMVEINNVPGYNLVPRGATALNDAIGRTINSLGAKLASISENDRPGKVLFVIVTDGEENSSKEFTKQQVREMIERQTNVYNWQFVFLGAGVDSFSESFNYGVSSGAKMNVQKSSQGTSNMFESLSNKFSSYRGMSMDSYNVAVGKGEFFDQEDRNKQL